MRIPPENNVRRLLPLHFAAFTFLTALLLLVSRTARIQQSSVRPFPWHLPLNTNMDEHFLSVESVPEERRAENKWIIIIDAGSSGSRVWVYENKLGAAQIHGEVRGLENVGFKSTEPGLSSFAQRTSELARHLRPLLDFAQQLIPSADLPSTPIYVLATAGLRLLSPNLQSRLLHETCMLIRREYPFHLPDCGEHVRVLTGEMEGIYGWLAVNYRSLLTGGERASIGFVDIGGASAQIAVEHEDGEEVRIPLGGRREQEVRVGSVSLLGYGSNEARRRYVQELITATSRDGAAIHDRIPDPCLPQGVVTYEVNVVLSGTGDYRRCRRLVSRMIKRICPVSLTRESAQCNALAATFASIEKFIGISEVYYVARALGLSKYEREKFELQTAYTCASKRWIAAKAAKAEGHERTLCFRAVWVSEFLEKINKGRALAEKSRQDEKKKGQRGATGRGRERTVALKLDILGDVSWTLGAAIVHIYKAKPASAAPPSTSWAFLQRHHRTILTYSHEYRTPLLSVVFLASAAVSVWIWWYVRRRRRAKRRSTSVPAWVDAMCASKGKGGRVLPRQAANGLTIRAMSNTNLCGSANPGEKEKPAGGFVLPSMIMYSS
ncbi:uncharacterized protein VTP21DRAFT_7929 [Calcarisporiella thermophila]|uniref:uncharacterized protein n=1 Tax=Calcarisporiella thermophila TaxID=911321 RepID=UPI003743BE8A